MHASNGRTSVKGVNAPSVTYRERQWVPLWWSVGLLLLAGSLVVAVWAFLGTAWGVGSLIAVAVLTTLGLLAWSRAVIVVAEDTTADEGSLTVAGARIETTWVSSAEALSPSASKTALRSGKSGEWLHLRPWLPRLVRIGVTDPADRHGSWLVASRDPEALAEAVRSTISQTHPDEARA